MPCGRRPGSRLKRVKQTYRRCSHGPVGRLPGVNSSAELLNRPQAGFRGELVESPHPYGQVASVAILRISAILLDV